MNKKDIKLAVIAGTVLLVALVLIMNDGLEKLSRLATIGGNIATNLANAHHGDPRGLDEMTVEHIKATTGSSKTVDVNELPKAFLPLKKYGHPPFTLGACSVCHASKSSKPAAITTRTVAQLCYKCHTPVEKISHKMAALDCNKCHSPHHADRKKLVRDKVTEKRCPVGKFER